MHLQKSISGSQCHVRKPTLLTHLYKYVYGFAGKIRVVDIAKSDANTPFAYAQFLEAQSKRIFDDLGGKNYLGDLDFESLIEEIANLAAELNGLHPFREGNGRTIRLFLIMLADHAGYLLDYSQVSASKLISADKIAFEGNIEPLLSVYSKVVVK